MTTELPLGKRESETLEFKASDALKNPAVIGREVVAFLNAGRPAEIWVGVTDDGALDPLRVNAKLLSALEDHLNDTIRPRASEWLHADLVTVRDSEVLLVRVTPPTRGDPFAQLKQGGWHFYVRAGSRVRPLEFHEIAARFRPDVEQQRNPLIDADARLRQERDRQMANSRQHLWVGWQPVWISARTKGQERIASTNRLLETWLQDPELTRNRRNGWNFANQYVQPSRGRDSVSLVAGENEVHVHGDGLVSFLATLDRLVWNNNNDNKLVANWPLCEFPTSLARLLATMLQTPEVCPESPAYVLADIGLSGAKGWKLCRFDPLRQLPMPWDFKTWEDEADLVWPEPLQFGMDEFLANPDRCAMRLVDRAYQAFGFRDDELPDLFDRASGKLK